MVETPDINEDEGNEEGETSSSETTPPRPDPLLLNQGGGSPEPSDPGLVTTSPNSLLQNKKKREEGPPRNSGRRQPKKEELYKDTSTVSQNNGQGREGSGSKDPIDPGLVTTSPNSSLLKKKKGEEGPPEHPSDQDEDLLGEMDLLDLTPRQVPDSLQYEEGLYRLSEGNLMSLSTREKMEIVPERLWEYDDMEEKMNMLDIKDWETLMGRFCPGASSARQRMLGETIKRMKVKQMKGTERAEVRERSSPGEQSEKKLTRTQGPPPSL